MILFTQLVAEVVTTEMRWNFLLKMKEQYFPIFLKHKISAFIYYLIFKYLILCQFRIC